MIPPYMLSQNRLTKAYLFKRVVYPLVIIDTRGCKVNLFLVLS